MTTTSARSVVVLAGEGSGWRGGGIGEGCCCEQLAPSGGSPVSLIAATTEAVSRHGQVGSAVLATLTDRLHAGASLSLPPPVVLHRVVGGIVAAAPMASQAESTLLILLQSLSSVSARYQMLEVLGVAYRSTAIGAQAQAQAFIRGDITGSDAGSGTGTGTGTGTGFRYTPACVGLMLAGHFLGSRGVARHRIARQSCHGLRDPVRLSGPQPGICAGPAVHHSQSVPPAEAGAAQTKRSRLCRFLVIISRSHAGRGGQRASTTKAEISAHLEHVCLRAFAYFLKAYGVGCATSIQPSAPLPSPSCSRRRRRRYRG